MNYKKIIRYLFISVTIMIAMLTISKEKVYASDNYGLWVGNIEITSDNYNNITGEGLSGKITYNPGTQTLTLNNAKINSGYVYYRKDDPYSGTYSAAGLYCTKNIKVELIGENTITPTIKLTGDYYYNKIQGMYVKDIEFKGTGSLSVSGHDYGILSQALSIAAGTSIKVTANNGSTGPCEGISASTILVNGELDCYAKAVFQPATGINAKSITVGKTGSIIAKAENPNTSYDAEAIHLSGTLTVNGVATKVDSKESISIKGTEKASNTTNNSTGSGKTSNTANNKTGSGKATNPLKLKAKTGLVKYSKLKKKAQSLAVTKVIKFKKKLNDKKTYTLSSAKKGKKSFKKYFKLNKKTGKVTVKKGLKKGTYKIKAKVKAAGNSKYKAVTKTVTFTIKVK